MSTRSYQATNNVYDKIEYVFTVLFYSCVAFKSYPLP